MLILAATTDKLQLVTSAAVTVDVHATYIDCSDASPPVVDAPNKQNTAITTATTTDIVAVPGANKRRNVKTLHIRNKHASTPVDVTVVYDQNGTDFELHKATLKAGESLEYVEGIGFFTLEGPDLQRTKALGSDQSNSTTTLTEVTGLSLTTGLGVFKFQYLIRYQAAALTTGVRFSVNHAGTVSFLVANVLFGDVSATAATAAPDQDQVLATAAVYATFTARAKATTGWGTTLSVDTVNADMLTIIDGLLEVTADGEIELWHGSEVAAASTVKAGSALQLVKIG